MPDGELRRPPQLWEQKLARTTSVLGVGVSSGDATAIVTDPPTPGTESGLEPAPTLPPPEAFTTPSAPSLTGGVQSIMVTWDGLTSTGDVYPYESAVVEVHQSTTTGFTPSASTLKGELRYPGNFTITGLTAGTNYYFRLRGRDAAGNYTTASAQASSTTGLTTTNDYGTGSIEAGAVSFNARAIGGITTSVGTTAPTSPVTGDIWLDSTGGAIVHKRWSGSAWVTQAWGSNSLSANCITATQIAAGAVTAGAILAGEVTAEKISSDAIDGKTITGATFRTSATAGTGTNPRAGVIIDTAGLRGFDASGNQTININASTGAVSISGSAITSGTITGRTVQSSSGAARIVLNNADTLDFYSSNVKRGDIYGVTVSGLDGLGVTGALDVSSTIFGEAISISGNTNTVGFFYSDELKGSDSTSVPNLRANTDTGQIVRTTHVNSSQRFKHAIVPLSDAPLASQVDQSLLADPLTQVVDPMDVLSLVPVQYRRNEAPSTVVTGFIAEDVEAKFPTAATYDDAGNLETIDVRGIVAGLLAVAQQQQQAIADLTARVTALEGA